MACRIGQKTKIPNERGSVCLWNDHNVYPDGTKMIRRPDEFNQMSWSKKKKQ